MECITVTSHEYGIFHLNNSEFAIYIVTTITFPVFIIILKFIKGIQFPWGKYIACIE